MSKQSTDMVSELSLAEIPFPVGEDRLVGVSLTRQRNLGFILEGGGAEAFQLVLQALHLALAMKVERVLWCSGARARRESQIEQAWNQLSEEFPDRVSRFDASVNGFPILGGLQLRRGTVLLMDQGFIEAGGGGVDTPQTVAVLRFVPPETLRANSITGNDSLAFVMSPAPSQGGLITQYLLKVPGQPSHVVDFERWQGWLPTAVRACRSQRSASIRFVEERWGGQRALCLGGQ